MRRKLLPFLVVLVGLYVGMGLLLQSMARHDRHTVEDTDVLDAKLSIRDTPLLKAVTQDNEAEVTRLITLGEDVNASNRVGRTPLLVAAREGNITLVNALIAAGADVNAHDRIGRTPLLYAIGNSQSLDVVLTLLERGADVNWKDRSGESPLLAAAVNGDTTLMEPLMQYGAVVDDRDRLGSTPLMRVARGMALARSRTRWEGQPGLIRLKALELLLDHGSRWDIRDRIGWNALLYAVENEPSEATQTLLRHGADPNFRVRFHTPLLNAASRGMVDNMDALIAAGASATPEECSAALMQAAMEGHDAAVQSLLDRGAEVNYRDQYGMTPLMHAMNGEHISTAKLLVMRGADPRLQDYQGKFALQYVPASRAEAIRKEVYGLRRGGRF